MFSGEYIFLDNLSTTFWVKNFSLQDKPNFLRIIDDIKAKQILSDLAILVTWDVAALYTNIAIGEGIEAVSKSLAINPRAHAPEV